MDEEFFFYATLSSVVIMDSMMLLACIIFFSLKNEYIILRKYSNYLVILQVLFASVDMWNIFLVLNRDAKPMETIIRVISDYCVFWTYWTQYMLGIIPWICIHQYKIIRHIFIFSRYMQNNRRFFPQKIFNVISLFVVIVPPMAIMVWITESIGFGSIYASGFGCGESIDQRISLSIWQPSIFMYIILYTLVIIRGIDDSHSSIYSSTKRVMSYGILVTIVCAIMRYTDAIYDPRWRFVYIILRNSFFLFALFNSIGYELVRAMIRDHKYLYEACNSFQFYDVIIYKIKDIHYSKTMMKKFIDHIRDKESRKEERSFSVLSLKHIKKRNSIEIDKDITIKDDDLVDPKVLVDCYSAIVKFVALLRKNRDREDLSEERAIANSIAVDYFENEKIHIPKYMLESMRTRINKCNYTTFTFELDFILETMDYYWGDEYFKGDRNSETIRMTHRVKSIHDDISEDGLIDDATEMEDKGVESDFVNDK